jgi:hypothetical protein
LNLALSYDFAERLQDFSEENSRRRAELYGDEKRGTSAVTHRLDARAGGRGGAGTPRHQTLNARRVQNYRDKASALRASASR